MRKYFPQDKNFILRGAQFDLRESLLSYLVDTTKDYYQQMYNPLGLLDDTTLAVREHQGYDHEAFLEFYEILSAIYRKHYGSNQLEFLFDGMDHYSKYTVDWEICCKKWCVELLGYEPFLKTVLQITVFRVTGHSRELAISRLRGYIHQHFNIKFYKYKGLQEVA